MTDATAAATPPSPDKASAFEDFIDIFYAPAKVFARRAKASATVPFLVVCVVLIALFFVNRNLMQPIIDAEIQRSMDATMKANPQMTAAQAEQGKGIARTIANVFTFIGVPIAILVLGLLTMVVGKILGGSTSYGTGLLIASFAWVPRIVENISISVQGLMMDTTALVSRTQLQFGLGRLLDPATTSAGALQLAARVDVFTLWVTVLLAIGLVHAGNVPKSKGVLAGVLVFVIGSLPALFQFLKG